MTAIERWRSWIQADPPPSEATMRHTFPDWLDDYLADAKDDVPFAAVRDLPRTDVLRILNRLWSGGLVPIGLRPQLEMVLLAALRHVARGRRVLIFTGMPADPSFSRTLTRYLSASLGLAVEATGHSFGRPAAPFKSALGADIVLCDYIQILEALKKAPRTLSDRPTAALACEADMCLYEARLGIFDRGELRALGCIYRSRGRKPWEAHADTLDFAQAADAFESIAGVTSYLTAELAGELRRCYGGIFGGGIRPLEGKRFSAYAFRQADTKIEWLCRDINVAPGDCLVFCADERLRLQLDKELGQRGQAPTALGSTRDLDTFLLMAGDRKRVGLFRGLPTLLRPRPETRPPIHVFVAQHYLLAHQHQKLRAFLDMSMTPAARPMLYFSLQDERFSIYVDEDSFQGAFELIEFTEKYDRYRRVRRVMARTMLRKIRRIRRTCLDEEYPILTVLNQARGQRPIDRRKRAGKHGRISRQLEAQCFCGSGKPFRECHGKAGT